METDKKHTGDIVVKIALAQSGVSALRIFRMLKKDPYQSRLSMDPIYLTNPRTGRSKVLSEYIEDIVGDQRLAI